MMTTTKKTWAAVPRAAPAATPRRQGLFTLCKLDPPQMQPVLRHRQSCPEIGLSGYSLPDTSAGTETKR